MQTITYAPNIDLYERVITKSIIKKHFIECPTLFPDFMRSFERARFVVGSTDFPITGQEKRLIKAIEYRCHQKKSNKFQDERDLASWLCQLLLVPQLGVFYGEAVLFLLEKLEDVITRLPSESDETSETDQQLKNKLTVFQFDFLSTFVETVIHADVRDFPYKVGLKNQRCWDAFGSVPYVLGALLIDGALSRKEREDNGNEKDNEKRCEEEQVREFRSDRRGAMMARLFEDLEGRGGGEITDIRTTDTSDSFMNVVKICLSSPAFRSVIPEQEKSNEVWGKLIEEIHAKDPNFFCERESDNGIEKRSVLVSHVALSDTCHLGYWYVDEKDDTIRNPPLQNDLYKKCLAVELAACIKRGYIFATKSIAFANDLKNSTDFIELLGNYTNAFIDFPGKTFAACDETYANIPRVPENDSLLYQVFLQTLMSGDVDYWSRFQLDDRYCGHVKGAPFVTSGLSGSKGSFGGRSADQVEADAMRAAAGAKKNADGIDMSKYVEERGGPLRMAHIFYFSIIGYRE